MAAELDFIIGRAGSGKSTACLSAMRAKMQEDPLGAPLLLIVPEHMTYRMERELATGMEKGHGFLRAHVFGFRRFARQVLHETDALALPRISEVGRRLLLRKILAEQRAAGSLDAFGRVVRQRGFTKSLSETLHELKSCRLTSEILTETADKLPEQGLLPDKLRAMAVLKDAFDDAMRGKADDEEDMMEKLAATLPSSPIAQGAEVWIDGFLFLNPQEMEVLAALLQTADCIHITLTMDGRTDAGDAVSLTVRENSSDTGLFHRSYEAYRAVLDMMGQRGLLPVPPSVTLLSDNPRYRHQPTLDALEKHLFQHGYGATAEGGGIAVTEASNRRIEAEAVAADILRLVREEGWRYSEIGVLVRQPKQYEPLLDIVFSDCGIPFYIDDKRPSTHHPLTELLRASLEIVQRNWPYEAVFRALRTGFFPLVPDDIDRLENYVLEFGLRGRKIWRQEADWDFVRRYSLDGEETVSSEKQEELAQLDGLRRLFVTSFTACADDLKAAGTVREMVVALYGFLSALEVPTQLEERGLLAAREGRTADAAEHEKIWSDIMDLFDQMVEVSGDEKMSLADFAAVLGDGIDALQISLIPPGLDYVTIASFDQNSLAGTRGLYIVGADSDHMPGKTEAAGMFSDADRLHMREAFSEIDLGDGLHPFLSRGSIEKSFNEQFLLYSGFAEASEYLWVSYSLSESDGTGLGPSPIVRKIRAMFPELTFRSIPSEMVRRSDDLLLYAPRPAVSALVNALRSAREGKDILPFWQDVYNWLLRDERTSLPFSLAISGLFARGGGEALPPVVARRLFAPKRFLRGSVTQFETFCQCPFHHFAKFGLRLGERRVYSFRRSEFGTLLHEVMREYGMMVKREYDSHWEAVPAEERKARASKLVDTIAPRVQGKILLSRANYRHMKERIKQTAEATIEYLTAWAAASSFEPSYLEERFGSREDKVVLAPIPLADGYRLSFKGQIDRLDVHSYAPYYLVVDYKTGNIDIELPEVYYGLRLQLLVYLMVGRELLKQEGEERFPAGMLYSLLRRPLITAEAHLTEEALRQKVLSKLRMPGWLLSDAEVIRAIDRSSDFIKVRFKKPQKGGKASEGEALAYQEKSKKYIKTKEEFALLMDYTEQLLQETGNEILDGSIKVYPFKKMDTSGSDDKARTACRFCPYVGVCGFDPEEPGYAYHVLENLEDEEAAERIRAAVEKKEGKEEEGGE